MVQDWSSITIEAFQNLWRSFLAFIPQIVGALLVFILGWLISSWVGKIIAAILKKLRFDSIFKHTKWENALEKADFGMTISDFIGAVIKWVLVIVFLLVSAEILNLSQFADFLRAIVIWLPNLLVAAAIFIVAAVMADFSEKLVEVVVGKMDVSSHRFLGSIVKWAIWLFAFLAILSQLGVASEIIETLVQGCVALFVISTGLAFGLGGKDVAKEILEGLKNKLKNRK